MSRRASPPRTAPMSMGGGTNPGGSFATPRKRVTYTITTVTGDLPGAGTGANVYVVLHGSIADSKRFHLQNLGKKSFVRGQTDSFTHVEPDLGEITALTISHDGKCNFRERFAPDWFLERASVRAGPSEWMFPCRRWLSKDQDDGQTRRTLYARNAEAQIQYKVLTFTDDRPQAGTLGKVWIQLHGDYGSAGGMTELKNPSLHDVFERGQKDLFIIRARPVGALNAVTIRHQNAKDGGRWGLAGVVVRNMKSGEEYTFPCGLTVGADETINLKMRAGAQIQVGTSQAAQRLEQGAIKNKLQPPVKVLSLDDHDPYKGMLQHREPPTRYDITVTTSDVKNAGTDSNVFVRLFGTVRSTGSIRLSAHATKTNRLFLRAQTDQFSLYLNDVGDLTRLSVWTDGRNLSDMGPTWHLHSIVVRKISHGGQTDMSWTFAANKLFDNGDGAHNVSKFDLIPSAGSRSGVRPRSAAQQAARPPPATQETGGGGAETELYGSRPGTRRPQTSRPATTMMYNNTLNPAFEQQLAGQVRGVYKVLVKTGNRPYAGTDCEVMLRVKGNARTTGTHRLSTCSTRAGVLFRRGATDEFAFQDWLIGDVVQVSIWHDGKGSDPNWFLEKVTVVAPDGRRYTFKLEDWLSETEGKRQTRFELTDPTVS